MSESYSVLGKDLVGLEPLTREQILTILDTAEAFKDVSERKVKKVPVLRGKTIVNAFFEASTRTKISFEFAEHGGHFGFRILGSEGRDAGGHGPEPGGHAYRYGGDAALVLRGCPVLGGTDPLQRHHRRRWEA